MTHDDQIARYWNSIQDWTTLVSHPVKMGLDKIFLKFLIDIEKKGYSVRTMVELADITDPFSYVVSANEGDKDASFTVFLDTIHDRHMAMNEEEDIPNFDEKKFSKWKPEDDTFDISMWDVDFGFGKIDEMNLDDLNSTQLVVFANSLMKKDPVGEFDRVESLDVGEYQSELYNITGDESYLPEEAKDIFLF